MNNDVLISGSKTQGKGVFANRDFKKGEEVTYDYSINGDNNGTFPCACGSKRCRRTYQGNFFKLPRELQLEYLPYLDEWFVQKHVEELYMKLGLPI